MKVKVQQAVTEVVRFAHSHGCFLHRWTAKDREVQKWENDLDTTVRELVAFGTANEIKIKGKVRAFWEIYERPEPGEQNTPAGGEPDYVVVLANELYFFKYSLNYNDRERWELVG